jgi:hypothetical protein
MAIALEGRPMGTYHLGVVHNSLGSTLGTKFEIKNDLSVESIPSSGKFLEGIIIFDNFTLRIYH